MTPPHHVDQPFEIGRVTHVFRREGASLDEVEDDNAGFGMHHARAETGQMRGAARSQLVRAHHAVYEDVVADANDVTAAAILNREVLIGDAAGQRKRLNPPGPNRQRRDARGRTLSPRICAHACTLPQATDSISTF